MGRQPRASFQMARQEYLFFIMLLAVVLDAALIVWLRRITKQRSLEQSPDRQRVYLFGEYSPVLTWLRYTMPRQLRDAFARLEEHEPVEAAPDSAETRAAARIQLEIEFDLSPVERVSFTVERRPTGALPTPTAVSGKTAALMTEAPAPSASPPALLRLPAWAAPFAGAASRSAGWALLIAAAALPALLVMRDRWLELPLNLPWLNTFWEQYVRSQSISLPAYFAVVLACWLALPWLVRALGKRPADPAVEPPHGAARVIRASNLMRRTSAWLMAAAFLGALIVLLLETAAGRKLGGFYLAAVLVFILAACLREHRLVGGWLAVRQHWRPALWMAALHILLMLFLDHFYGDRRSVWLWGLLLAGALLIALRSSIKLPGIFWLANFALILYTIRIDGWEFSVIGDEYSFFTYAQELANNPNWLPTLNKLFDGTAVYGSHPFLSSVIQAIFSAVFTGSSNFGWRISNLYLAALSLMLLYLFFKYFLPARISLLAVALLAPAHYLMTFGKIGYNNLQAFFAAALVLAAGAWAVHRRSEFSLVMFGTAMGLCFYVYPAALYILPVAALLLLFYDPPTDLPAIRRWLVVGLSLALLVLPLLFQPDYWREKLPGTWIYQVDITSTPGRVGGHFASNLLYAFLSFLFIPQESHFVVVSYLDALSGIFFILGWSVLLAAGWKNRFWIFLVASLLVMLFLVGASHGGRYPPTTRMFMLLPFWTLIAALGMEWILVQMHDIPRLPQSLRTWLPALALLAVLGLNLYQAYILSPRRSTGYQSPAMLFVRILERIRARESVEPQNLVFAFLTIPPWGIDGYSLMMRTYDIPPALVRLEEVVVSQNELPQSSLELLRSPQTMVVIYPDMEENIQSALVGPVQALGKLPCPMRTLSGVIRFSLWVSPTMEWICAARQ